MHQSLPLFPNMLDPKLEKVFASLCGVITPRQVAELNKQIAAHLISVREALRYNEFIDLALAERIANTLTVLLEELANYPEGKQKLIVGAARYFTRDQDAQADFASILGFDDDATVLNYVLIKIGRIDLKVEL
jgi:uncharacterized membrane protein YkvA (DUF1232 family)